MINGKNANPRSAWEKHGLPALEYCKLDRASELLGCKVDDLLHWAEIGAIELCLEFDGFDAQISLPIDRVTETVTDNVEKKEIYKEWIECQLYKVLEYLDPIPIDGAPLSKIEPKWDLGELVFYELWVSVSKDMDVITEIAPIISLHGLWSLCVNIRNPFKEMRLYGYSEWRMSHLLLTPADINSEKYGIYRAYGARTSEDLIAITPRNLLITKEQIRRICETRGNSFSLSYVNGEVRPISFRRKKEEDTNDVLIHGNARNNARRRENILLALGYVKFHYPKECERSLKSGGSKESANAWAEALLNHWALFGEETEAPTVSYLLPIIRDIYRLPNQRKCAGVKVESKFKNAK